MVNCTSCGSTIHQGTTQNSKTRSFRSCLRRNQHWCVRQCDLFGKDYDNTYSRINWYFKHTRFLLRNMHGTGINSVHCPVTRMIFVNGKLLSTKLISFLSRVPTTFRRNYCRLLSKSRVKVHVCEQAYVHVRNPVFACGNSEQSRTNGVGTPVCPNSESTRTEYRLTQPALE